MYAIMTLNLKDPLTLNEFAVHESVFDPKNDDINLQDWEELVDFFAMHTIGRTWWNAHHSWHSEVHV